MSKHIKNAAPENQLSVPNEFPASHRHDTPDLDQSSDQAPKSVNGIWIAVFLLGLLILLFIQHWLRQ